jgi:hypothetical protein
MDNKKIQNLPIKVFASFTVLVGSSVIIVAPFCYSLTSLLGTIGCILASTLTMILFTAIAFDGFDYVKKQSQNDLFLQILVYVVSLSLQISAITLSLRIIKYAASHLLNLKFDFFDGI